MAEASAGASSSKKRLGILISGRGSNMASLVEAAAAPDCPYTVALVASDKPEAAGLAWAAERGVPTFAQSPKGMPKADYEAKIDSALRDAGVEAIALAGYMRLLSDDFVARWRGRIVLTRDPDGGERCVGCYLCAAACPVDCISLQATRRARHQ